MLRQYCICTTLILTIIQSTIFYRRTTLMTTMKKSSTTMTVPPAANPAICPIVISPSSLVGTVGNEGSGVRVVSSGVGIMTCNIVKFALTYTSSPLCERNYNEMQQKIHHNAALFKYSVLISDNVLKLEWCLFR